MVSFSKCTTFLALSLLPAVVSVCDKDVFDFPSFTWKTCPNAGSISLNNDSECKADTVNSECLSCNNMPSFISEGDCSQTICGLDARAKTIQCEGAKNECKDIDEEMCETFFEEFDMALTLAGMGCKTSVYDVYQEAIRLGVVSKDQIREEKPDYTDEEVKEAEDLMKNFRIGDACPVKCNLCEEEIAMTVTVPAASIPDGETAASLGKQFVAVTCLTRNYFLTPTTDASNDYDLEFAIDFDSCPFKLEEEEVASRRLEEDGGVSFVMVADNAAMNQLEIDMIDTGSEFNEIGSELMPDFIGENKVVTTESEKDIAAPGLGIIGLLVMVAVVLILIICCCCVCCCRYVCKCCCRCGMDSKPKSASSQDVEGVEMN